MNVVFGDETRLCKNYMSGARAELQSSSFGAVECARCIIMHSPAVLLFSVWLPSGLFSLLMWIARCFKKLEAFIAARRRASETIIRAFEIPKGFVASEFCSFFFFFLSFCTSIRLALHIALLIIAITVDRVLLTRRSFLITTGNRNATYGASRGYGRI